jgi:hypothetical protein
MREGRPYLVAAVLLVLAAPTQRAWAAPSGAPSDASEQQRAALYRDGVALANAGRWDDAVKKFRQVIAIRSAPPALFTLGQAEEHLGQLATAERTYERALADARASGTTDVADAAVKAIASLEPRVPRVLIKLTPAASGAAASVDGAAAPLGEPVKVDPGDHAVVVRAPGKLPFESRVHMVEGQSLDLSAALQSEAPAPGPTLLPPPPHDDRPGRFPVGPAVLAGAGVVAGVVGLVVRLGGQSTYDDATQSCGPAGCPSQDIADRANSGRSQMLVGTAFLGIGIAAIAGAGVWWALTPRNSAGSPGTSVGLALSPTRDGTRATFTASF